MEKIFSLSFCRYFVGRFSSLFLYLFLDLQLGLTREWRNYGGKVVKKKKKKGNLSDIRAYILYEQILEKVRKWHKFSRFAIYKMEWSMLFRNYWHIDKFVARGNIYGLYLISSCIK